MRLTTTNARSSWRVKSLCSRHRQFVFFDEQWPVVASFEYDASEVSEVPGENACVASVSHGHDRQISEVDAGIGVLLPQVERQLQLWFCRCIELVDANEQCSSKHE